MMSYLEKLMQEVWATEDIDVHDMSAMIKGVAQKYPTGVKRGDNGAYEFQVDDIAFIVDALNRIYLVCPWCGKIQCDALPAHPPALPVTNYNCLLHMLLARAVAHENNSHSIDVGPDMSLYGKRC